jgi:CRISPR-associated protein Cas1
MDIDDSTDTGSLSALSDEDVAESLALIAETYGDSAVGETVLCDGFGVAVRVRHGELELADGLGPHRRTRRISRADRHVKRVIVPGEGYVTTEALTWCDHVGIALAVVDSDGKVLGANSPALFDHAGLRQSQAVAPLTSMGVELARFLIDRRLADQARIAKLMGNPVVSRHIEDQRLAVIDCDNVAALMATEAKAADEYWFSWVSAAEARFASKDARRVPDRWRHFQGRRSPLNEQQSNRHAVTPIGALLNYGFKLCEIEATILSLSCGLDPSMGVAHGLRQGRPSFALDIVEAGRGVVEETVWRLCQQRTFLKADFHEMATGQIRVLAPLSHEFSTNLMPVLRDTLAPVVERVAAMLASIARVDVRVPTSLTRSRHGKVPKSPPVRWKPRCRWCARPLPANQQTRTYCDACLPQARAQRNLATVGTKGRRRPQRRDYATDGDARRAERMAAIRAAEQAWERAHRGIRRPDPTEFAAIRDALAGLGLDVIAETIGVSKTAAGRIRRGQLVPHIRHWRLLADLAHVSLPEWSSREATSDHSEENGR